MATAVLPETGFTSSQSQAVAPWRHTALLIAFFVAMAAGGAALQYQARGRAVLVEQRPNVVSLYISLMAGEWGLVYYVWKGGLRRKGIGLLQFIGGSWDSARAVFQDIILAAGLWGLWTGAGICWERLFAMGHAASISTLTPRGPVEAVLWVMLSVSAGICEELVFRGYLQRQLTALTGRASLGLLLQVSLFGVAHSYQGLRACLSIVLYGALFTLLALWRKSLRPGMMAHAWTDIVGGLLG